MHDEYSLNIPDNAQMLPAIEWVAAQMPGGFFIYRADETQEILYINHALCRIFGCETTEEFQTLTGNTFPGMIHPDDRENVQSRIQEQISDSTNENLDYVQYRIVQKDGSIRWVDDYGHFTNMPEYGDVYYVFLSDITEKHLSREQQEQRKLLENALAEAQAANQAKTSFLSNMSHDIRTPMNAIIGFTDLALLDTGNQKLIEEYLTKIKASSEHLLSLINDVLEMSRIESGKIELNETPVNLPDVLHDLSTIIIGQVEGKHQELFMDTLNVKDENILCDKLRLNQVLLNLISNAVKCTPTGGKISVRIIQKQPSFNGAAPYEIRVKDTGIGMTSEFAEKVFEAFERENTSTVSGIQGTGLGMAITKRIVELMGGNISVKTAPSKGSEFIVSVSFKVQKGKKRDYRIPQLAGVHALVVDDDYDACDSITKLLSDMELRSEWTLSGKEAILRAKHARERGDSFGVYIIDWKMPDLSGIEVARRLRNEIGEDTPILLMTAYDWLAIKEEAIEAGIKGFCNKPVFASELHASLISVIGTNEPAAAEEETETQLTEDFSGKRLLLTEDILINRQIALTMLEMYGFEVEEAENGKEAVEKVENAKTGYYDAILMDIQMPVMNGYEAAKAIRALPNDKGTQIPILAMTANAFDEDIQLALNAGMSGHIAKPIDREKLVSVLGKFL